MSIAVIGLYIAYVIPIYLRWRMGDEFEAGPWNLGSKYKWMNPLAVVWVAIITVIFILPTTPAGVPWRDEFDWSAVNYAPLVTGGMILAVGLWWLLGAKNTFTGPRHTVAELDAELGEGHSGRRPRRRILDGHRRSLTDRDGDPRGPGARHRADPGHHPARRRRRGRRRRGGGQGGVPGVARGRPRRPRAAAAPGRRP